MRRLIRTIRNLVALLIAAIIILGCVLGINALLQPSRQIKVAAIPRVAIDEKSAADHLSAAIRFRTISSATETRRWRSDLDNLVSSSGSSTFACADSIGIRL